MSRCPDCDGVAITLGSDVGNGKCDSCHGTGESILGALASAVVPIDADRTAAECDNCGGSGVCPTCGGSGEI